MEKKPWWYPKVADKVYCDKLRHEYHYGESITDEEIIEANNDGRKFVTLWDSVDEAYAQFEHVAEMMLRLENELRLLRTDIKYLVEEGTLPEEVVANHATILGVDKLLTELKGPDYGPREKTPTGGD